MGTEGGARFARSPFTADGVHSLRRLGRESKFISWESKGHGKMDLLRDLWILTE
jgi:hypothetical protein